MKKHLSVRLLSLLLVVAMLFSFAVPVRAAEEPSVKLPFEQVDNSAVSAPRPNAVEEREQVSPAYADTDIVRVSIVMEQASALEAGFSTQGIATNQAAVTYRQELRAQQDTMTDRIEKAIGAPLDVAWNLTLAANLISANVAYGQIGAIEQVPGVREVILENRYEPQTGETVDPNMMVSVDMTGTQLVWNTGYTGAGGRIAVIDTGMQVDHNSFDPDALAFALEQTAQRDGLTYEEYLEKLDVLDAGKIGAVLNQLHVYEKSPEFTPEDLYVNLKTPFAYNYVDQDLDVSHVNDVQSEHGSHVAGIAAANRYLQVGQDQFVYAGDEVGVVGNAPDAQILVMKVFGKNGGAYESDFMAAIEDAIVLGCEAVNLSLGSANPGNAISGDYQDVMEALTESDSVVVMSAGNSGYWSESSGTVNGKLYADDVNFHTGGSPGSYGNSLSVASVNNDGNVGAFLMVNGNKFGYNETGGYANQSMTTLDPDKTGTEYEYVFVDGLGEAADYEGIDLNGKVVFCSRGVTAFSDKGNIAASLGAVAIVVCNNEPGIINMDLTGYEYPAPCVSITQDAGILVKENSTEVSTEAGLKYYTGKITISGSISANVLGSDYLTMSDFSSWGVPGDLSLKPEITAPGGRIYSVNGAHNDGQTILGGADQYEVMSGTSMAAPQISGIAVLVRQAIEARGLSQEGLTDRALAQSLMMSTAEPLKDANGNYYSLMQQGAGFVDTAAATGADSYVLVKGQDDGKIKAELGDDPDREGVYSFEFSLNNLTDQEKVFTLSADVFTQDVFQDYANWNYSDDEMASYLDTATRFLNANVLWTADGQMVSSPGELDACDFDDDGDVDADDGQALLDYVTGARASIANAAAADLDQDGGLDTYDAYLLLGRLGKDTVVVPADGSVNVTVTIELTTATKALLDADYTNGAYIQAYIYAEALSDAEGVEGTSHSIPMLSFYGNWTDGSMYDVGSYPEFDAGDETRLPYLGSTTVNYLVLSPGYDPTGLYQFGGNPVTPDETYMPERNAINTERGDSFQGWDVSIIRNAANSRFSVMDLETGEAMFDKEMGAVNGAYYHTATETWNLTSNILTLSDLWRPDGLAEGSRFELKLALAPEYYLADDGSTDWEALGHGASLTVPVLVDNTAPVLMEASVNFVANNLTVTAQDNQHIAAVSLYNAKGTRALAVAGAKADAEPGACGEYVLSLEDIQGKSFLVQVTDYAMNTTTYALDMQLGGEVELPEAIAFDLDFGFWTTVSKDTQYDESLGLEVYAESEYYFMSATIADHVVMACTDEGKLYAMPEDDLSGTALVADMGMVLDDMAYNAADGMVYGICEGGTLFSIDKLTGETEYLGYLDTYTNTLACDENGTFYCNELGTGKVYAFTLDTLELTPVVDAIMIDGLEMETNYPQAMEINPNNGMLCWTSYSIDPESRYPYAYYIEIRPETGEYTVYNDLWDALGALIIPDKSAGGSWSDPTDQVSGVWISNSYVEVLKGGTVQLSAAVLPWTASDRSVIWSSSDETVATVDASGVVTAISAGEVEITAAATLNPAITTSCTVVVNNLEITLEGIIQDAESKPMFFRWNMATEETWTGGNALSTTFTSATRDPLNDVLYVMSSANPFGVHKVDMATGETLESAVNITGVPLWDMEYSQVFSTPEAPRISGLYDCFLLPCKDPMALDTEALNLAELLSITGADYFAAIASGGYEQMESNGVLYDTERYHLLDTAGYLWILWVYEDADGKYKAFIDFYQVDLGDLTFPGSGDHLYCSMVMGEDGALYLSYFDGSTNVLYRIDFDWSAGTYKAMRIGDVGSDVWPAVLYAANSNETAEGNRVPARKLMYVESQTLSAEEMMAAAEMRNPHRSNDSTDRQAKAMLLAERADDSQVIPMGVEAQDDCQEAAVTLTLTADTATTNGLITVEYDADKLTLVETAGKTAYHSYSNKEGKVTIGYVNPAALAAGSDLATLTFTAEQEETFHFTVTTVEDGRTAPGTVEVVTLASPYCPSAGYKDVPMDVWYHDSVDYVLQHGLMKGRAEGIFAPNAKLTRAELVTVLYRMAGEPSVEGKTHPFTDVAEGAWYTDAITWAFNAEVVNGISETTFAPNANVAREQIAAMLFRFAGAEAVEKNALESFTDAAKVSPYALEAMNWAVSNGLIKGTTATTLAPREAASRAQAATILTRYSEN